MTKNLIKLMDERNAKEGKKSQKYSLGKIKKEIEKEYDEIFYNKEVIIKKTLLDIPYRSLEGDEIKLDCFYVDKFHVDINEEINNLSDLINMINKNPPTENVEYNINMEPLYKIKPNLKKLNNMIGMKSLKENVVNQIIYFLQDLMQSDDGDFLHTVIYGPPGTGKTEIAKIIGKIYSKIGILKKNKFKKATRSDMIAGYLGQTAIKTSDLIKESLGGVLFIDEAYALGNAEGRDSFSKEAIDTLCEALSDHKHDLMVIIAGYEDELKKCFFNYNKGLDSRFTWRFKTDDYSAEELKNIFEKKVKEAMWSLEENCLSDEWFEKHMPYFKYYGRDMETLFSRTKICHSKRVFCLPKSKKKIITKNDIENGFNNFLNNDEVKKRLDNDLANFNQIYS